jgi:hypothetical protein
VLFEFVQSGALRAVVRVVTEPADPYHAVRVAEEIEGLRRRRRLSKPFRVPALRAGAFSRNRHP